MSLKDQGGRRTQSVRERAQWDGYSGGTKRYQRPRRHRRGFAGPVLIICAIVAVLVAADYWANSGEVYGGVEIGDVPLGGRTPGEAEEVVRERAMASLEEIKLSGPQDFTRTAEEMGVRFNVESTVDRAYAVGREGNVFERISERARALSVGVRIPPEVDYQAGRARAEVEEIASQVNREPQEANVEVLGAQVQVGESREGFELDPSATMRSIDSAVADMSGEAKIAGSVLQPTVTTAEAETTAEKAREAVSEQISLSGEGQSWTLSPADIGSTLEVSRENGALDVGINRALLDQRLGTVYGDLAVKPKEAYYEIGDNGVYVVGSREGRAVEQEEIVGSISSGLFEGKREYSVPVTIDKPQYTTAELEAQKPTELLGSYKTNYTATTDQGAERVANLEIASGAVNGQFVAPGDTFSMVEHVQNLDYNDAHVIVDSKEEIAEGGGLCQVTSTLYNAVLYAGLPVVERQPHDSQLPYIRPGMDSTVWYGDTTTTADDVDMKFRNTTDGYILIEEYVSDDGYMYANIYGVPDNVEVEMSSEEVWITADASEWVTNYTRYKNGRVVYEDSWNSEYSALYDDEGKKIDTRDVPIAEVDGNYYGLDFSAIQ